MRFGLRDADRLTVTIVDADGGTVRTIAEGEELSAGPVEFVVGRPRRDRGRVPRAVHLADARRTIVIPNEMRLDTTPPDADGRVDPRRACSRPTATGGPTPCTPSSGLGARGRCCCSSTASARSKTPAAQGGEARLVRARAPTGERTARSVRATSPATATADPRRRPSGSGSSSSRRDGSSFRLACASASASRPTSERYRWQLGVAHAGPPRRGRSCCAPAQPGRYTLPCRTTDTATRSRVREGAAVIAGGVLGALGPGGARRRAQRIGLGSRRSARQSSAARSSSSRSARGERCAARRPPAWSARRRGRARRALRALAVAAPDGRARLRAAPACR